MNKTKDKKIKEEPVSLQGVVDEEYCVRSNIANSKSIPFQEGYPVIRRPAYAIVHDGPDEIEYCMSMEDQSYYAESDDYELDDSGCYGHDPGYNASGETQDYGVHRKTRYPHGYDA